MKHNEKSENEETRQESSIKRTIKIHIARGQKSEFSKGTIKLAFRSMINCPKNPKSISQEFKLMCGPCKQIVESGRVVWFLDEGHALDSQSPHCESHRENRGKSRWKVPEDILNLWPETHFLKFKSCRADILSDIPGVWLWWSRKLLWCPDIFLWPSRREPRGRIIAKKCRKTLRWGNIFLCTSS